MAPVQVILKTVPTQVQAWLHPSYTAPTSEFIAETPPTPQSYLIRRHAVPLTTDDRKVTPSAELVPAHLLH